MKSDRRKYVRWSEKDTQILTSLYFGGEKELILDLLPNYSWKDIKQKENALGLRRNNSRPRTRWTDELTQRLIESYPTMKREEVLKVFPEYSWEVICRKANSLGLRRIEEGLDNRNFYTTEQELYIRQNFGILPVEDLAKGLDTSVEKVRSKAYHLAKNYPIKKYSNAHHYKYSCNDGFFLKPNKRNSYWAGFIAADGHIHDKEARLSVRLANRDYEHLCILKEDLSYNNNVKIWGKAAVLSLNSRQIVNDLEKNFNVVTKKSFTLTPPAHLSALHSLCFIIGYIDGDGSLSSSVVRSHGGRHPCLSVLGTYSVIAWIQQVLNELTPCDHLKLSLHPNNQTRYFSISGKGARKIISELRQIQGLPKLRRKWNRGHLIKHGFLTS